MRLRRLEFIGTDERLAGQALVAQSPRGRARRIAADHRDGIGAVLVLEPLRAVAAEVARILPELAILVEILRREQIDGQRLDAGRHGTVPCRTHGKVNRFAGRAGAARGAARGRTHRTDEGISNQIFLHLRGFLRCQLPAGKERGLTLDRQRDRERRTATDAPEAGIHHELRGAFSGGAESEQQQRQRDEPVAAFSDLS